MFPERKRSPPQSRNNLFPTVEKVKSGVDMITAFRDKVPADYRTQTDPYINGLLKGLADKKTAAGLTEQAAYINSKIQK